MSVSVVPYLNDLYSEEPVEVVRTTAITTGSLFLNGFQRI